MKIFRCEFLCILLFAAITSSGSQSLAARLNIVLIVADDLGWGELGCYGQQKFPHRILIAWLFLVNDLHSFILVLRCVRRRDACL